MVLMYWLKRSSPSATILAGVSATANSAGVALLTLASVACADSTTATSNVNGVTYWSSPTGSGLAAAKRRNASSISASLQAGGTRGLRERGFLDLAGRDGLEAGLRAGLAPARLPIWGVPTRCARTVLRTMVPFSRPH